MPGLRPDPDHRCEVRPRHAPSRWHRLLEEGVHTTRAALARAEGVRAAVTKALRGSG